MGYKVFLTVRTLLGSTRLMIQRYQHNTASRIHASPIVLLYDLRCFQYIPTCRMRKSASALRSGLRLGKLTLLVPLFPIRRLDIHPPQRSFTRGTMQVCDGVCAGTGRMGQGVLAETEGIPNEARKMMISRIRRAGRVLELLTATFSPPSCLMTC